MVQLIKRPFGESQGAPWSHQREYKVCLSMCFCVDDAHAKGDYDEKPQWRESREEEKRREEEKSRREQKEEEEAKQSMTSAGFRSRFQCVRLFILLWPVRMRMPFHSIQSTGMCECECECVSHLSLPLVRLPLVSRRRWIFCLLSLFSCRKASDSVRRKLNDDLIFLLHFYHLKSLGGCLIFSLFPFLFPFSWCMCVSPFWTEMRIH